MFVVLAHFYSARPTPAYQEIASALRRRSHRVWIGQPDLDGRFVFRDEAQIVDALPRAPGGRAGGLPAMLDVRRRLRDLRPDVVQITPHPWSWLLAIGAPPGTVMINDIRTAGSGGGGVRGRLVDRSAWLSWRLGAAWLYDGTTLLNDTGARWLFGGSWPRYADVVPLGVDTAFLAGSPAGPARTDSAVRFVYVGTISLVRSLGRLLEAAALLSSRTRSFSLTLVGPDDGRGGVQEVTALVARHALEPIVRILPPVSYGDVPALLGQFDVALNYVPANPVQRRQTFMKVLECRALGMPQITTATPPNAEVVDDGRAGLLVDDSAEAYADAMSRVITEPDLLSRLRTGARERRTGVTWDDVAAAYETLYRRLGVHRES